nr:hypothetical protein [Tanacetum cinerariifolium]
PLDQVHASSANGIAEDCQYGLLSIPTASDEFPLPEDFPTASEERFPMLRIQQYLQNEHYALWEVIEFGDSYEAPQDDAATGSASSASEGSAKKKGKTVAVTTKDMQKRRNDVKVRTTLLLALPDEHQLRFSKYKTAQELQDAILKTFGGNEATKKTKKNQLKQQYGNFKAEGDTNRVEADLSNMENNISASLTPTFRIHKDHPTSQIIGPMDTPVQTKTKSKEMEEQSFIASIHHMTNPDLLQFCLFSCFLSHDEPKKIFDALKDPSWVEAMQEELLQFKIQNV